MKQLATLALTALIAFAAPPHALANRPPSVAPAPAASTPPEGYEYQWVLIQTFVGDMQTNARAREGWEPVLVGPSNSSGDFYVLFRRKKAAS